MSKEGEVDQDVFAAYQDKFAEAMGSDINTSQALTVLYDVLKADTNDATKRALIEDFDQVLSLGLLAEEAQIRSLLLGSRKRSQSVKQLRRKKILRKQMRSVRSF